MKDRIPRSGGGGEEEQRRPGGRRDARQGRNKKERKTGDQLGVGLGTSRGVSFGWTMLTDLDINAKVLQLKTNLPPLFLSYPCLRPINETAQVLPPTHHQEQGGTWGPRSTVTFQMKQGYRTDLWLEPMGLFAIYTEHSLAAGTLLPRY